MTEVGLGRLGSNGTEEGQEMKQAEALRSGVVRNQKIEKIGVKNEDVQDQ